MMQNRSSVEIARSLVAAGGNDGAYNDGQPPASSAWQPPRYVQSGNISSHPQRKSVPNIARLNFLPHTANNTSSGVRAISMQSSTDSGVTINSSETGISLSAVRNRTINRPTSVETNNGATFGSPSARGRVVNRPTSNEHSSPTNRTGLTSARVDASNESSSPQHFHINGPGLSARGRDKHRSPREAFKLNGVGSALAKDRTIAQSDNRVLSDDRCGKSELASGVEQGVACVSNFEDTKTGYVSRNDQMKYVAPQPARGRRRTRPSSASSKLFSKAASVTSNTLRAHRTVAVPASDFSVAGPDEFIAKQRRPTFRPHGPKKGESFFGKKLKNRTISTNLRNEPNNSESKLTTPRGTPILPAGNKQHKNQPKSQNAAASTSRWQTLTGDRQAVSMSSNRSEVVNENNYIMKTYDNRAGRERTESTEGLGKERRHKHKSKRKVKYKKESNDVGIEGIISANDTSRREEEEEERSNISNFVIPSPTPIALPESSYEPPSSVVINESGHLVYLHEKHQLCVSGRTNFGNYNNDNNNNQLDVSSSSLPPSSLDGGSAVEDPLAVYRTQSNGSLPREISGGGSKIYGKHAAAAAVVKRRKEVPKPNSSIGTLTPRVETDRDFVETVVRMPTQVGAVPLTHQYNKTRSQEVASLALVSMRESNSSRAEHQTPTSEDLSRTDSGSGGVVFARSPGSPTSIVIRTAAFRLRCPEKLVLNNRKLDACPRIEGEANLKVLSMRGNAIESIRNLDNVTRLVYLDLSRNRITSTRGLTCLPSLRVLLLGENKIASVCQLSHLERLDVLDLHANDIQDIQGIACLSSLRVLNLSDNNLNSMEHFVGLSSLTDLQVCRNQISSTSGLLVNDTDNIHTSLPSTLLKIGLSGNQIHTIHDLCGLFSLAALTHVNIADNPLLLDNKNNNNNDDDDKNNSKNNNYSRIRTNASVVSSLLVKSLRQLVSLDGVAIVNQYRSADPATHFEPSVDRPEHNSLAEHGKPSEKKETRSLLDEPTSTSRTTVKHAKKRRQKVEQVLNTIQQNWKQTEFKRKQDEQTICERVMVGRPLPALNAHDIRSKGETVQYI